MNLNDHDIEQRHVWQAVAFVSGAAAAAGVRRVAATLWRTGRHDDPPVHPAAGDVGWRDALIWATSVAVGAAAARVVAQRTAAAAWHAATGAPPPGVDD
jgi:Protein of unknown function (DUF4235)